MESNEITMFMEVKLDIHNKRPDSLKFKQWSKCEVKIEGIKCLPSYLRLTITGCNDDALNETSELQRAEGKRCICVSIIVPGVSISLAASRTKDFSYGLFWTQYRKQCYIYFALETDTSCRRHMKWIKKTIKNLELHRQLMLEQNRISRGPSMGVAVGGELLKGMEKENFQRQEDDNISSQSPYSALGPLPNIPTNHDCNQSSISQRISHISDIYEEIIECVGGQPRLSRRVSRASIASGIYEEMKPSATEFNAIDEECSDFSGNATSAISSPPPPLPPLPPPRKRINTFDGQGAIGELPRCNTNPESELAKKKKYKNVLDIIFGSGRAKRAESVSETQACTAEDIINSITPTKPNKHSDVVTPIYANEALKPKCVITALANSKRNSFSSPDLSKINYLDDGATLGYSLSPSEGEELHLSVDSLDNVCATTPNNEGQTSNVVEKVATDGLNVSEKLPNNFNFSAANCSSINLIGFNGAIPSSNQRKNEILIDDLTGYCVMAPIKSKTIEQPAVDKSPAEPVSSGYSTGSYPSTSSSSADGPKSTTKTDPIAVTTTAPATATTAEESAIYEQMLSFRATTVESEASKCTSKVTADSPNTHAYTASASTSSNVIDFTGNLYENLLAVKASQELEQQLPTSTLSTSTPTESPLTQPAVSNDEQILDEEDYYQTPRKSIISVDDKVPSYYPNSCDTVKTRRHHTLASGSPQQTVYNTSPTVGTTGAAVASTNEKPNIATTSVGLRQLVTLKIRRERKENIYMSSPQGIIEQRQNGVNYTKDADSKNLAKNCKPNKSIKAGALKIAEHVYTVKHPKQKCNTITTNDNNLNNNNETDDTKLNEDMRERLHTELLHFALLQKIDFKFDDANSAAATEQISCEMLKTPSPSGQRQQHSNEPDHIYENLRRQQSSGSPTADTKPGMHQSCIAGVHVVEDAVQVTDSCNAVELGGGLKKFASLPRFKKIDFSPLRLRINNVLQRGQQQDF